MDGITGPPHPYLLLDRINVCWTPAVNQALCTSLNAISPKNSEIVRFCEIEMCYWHMLLLLSHLQSCPTLCDPIDGSPPGSPVPGILQARTLEWVGTSFSNAWKWKVKVKSFSCVRPSATPWTAACQAPPSMGVSRKEYWNGVPGPSPYWRISPIISTMDLGQWLPTSAVY